MASLKQDTEQVKQEFEGLSNATQVFIWSLVGLGVVIGLLIGAAIGYGVSVEDVDGRPCIEYDGTRYCADEQDAAA